MNHTKAALIAVGTFFVTIAQPVFADGGEQYAEIQVKKLTEVKGKRVQTREVRGEASANSVGSNLIYRIASTSDQARAAWITVLPTPIQAKNLYFTCFLNERGVFFKQTVEPIVRIEYSTVKNAQLKYLTVPFDRENTIIHCKLNQVDGANPIIHRIAVVALAKEGVVVDDYADMRVYDMKVDISYVKPAKSLLEPIVDNGSDLFIEGATH